MTTTCQGRLAVRSSATGCGSYRLAAVGQGGGEQPGAGHLGQQERRHLGHELPAGSVTSGPLTFTNMTRNINVRITLPGIAAEQVQRLLGRGADLSGSV